MGVITFALMPLLGLMAGGLGELRVNMDRHQAVNISQQILVEAEQMDFHTLAGKGTYTEYFTLEGDLVNAGSPQIAYKATVTVSNPTDPSKSKSAPLQGSLSNATPPLVTLVALQVVVRKTPGGIDNASNPNLATIVNMVSCDDLSALTTAPSGQ
ncbi:MAG: hypothetical protein WDO13_21450 [Verrucomicrobiota bacterium]